MKITKLYPILVVLIALSACVEPGIKFLVIEDVKIEDTDKGRKLTTELSCFDKSDACDVEGCVRIEWLRTDETEQPIKYESLLIEEKCTTFKDQKAKTLVFDIDEVPGANLVTLNFSAPDFLGSSRYLIPSTGEVSETGLEEE